MTKLSVLPPSLPLDGALSPKRESYYPCTAHSGTAATYEAAGMGGAGWAAAPHPGEPELFGSGPSAYPLPRGKYTKQKQAVISNPVMASTTTKVRSLGSLKDTCLCHSHKPCFSAFIAVNAYPSHPQTDGRSTGIPSFCHSLTCVMMLLLDMHQHAGHMHGLLNLNSE